MRNFTKILSLAFVMLICTLGFSACAIFGGSGNPEGEGTHENPIAEPTPGKKTIKLDAPQNLRIYETDEYGGLNTQWEMSWAYVQKARGYTVMVDGEVWLDQGVHMSEDTSRDYTKMYMSSETSMAELGVGEHEITVQTNRYETKDVIYEASELSEPIIFRVADQEVRNFHVGLEFDEEGLIFDTQKIVNAVKETEMENTIAGMPFVICSRDGVEGIWDDPFEEYNDEGDTYIFRISAQWLFIMAGEGTNIVNIEIPTVYNIADIIDGVPTFYTSAYTRYVSESVTFDGIRLSAPTNVAMDNNYFTWDEDNPISTEYRLWLQFEGARIDDIEGSLSPYGMFRYVLENFYSDKEGTYKFGVSVGENLYEHNLYYIDGQPTIYIESDISFVEKQVEFNEDGTVIIY